MAPCYIVGVFFVILASMTLTEVYYRWKDKRDARRSQLSRVQVPQEKES